MAKHTTNKSIKITKDILIPTFSKGFCKVGFLFGAGTSFEAGYPLMANLTNSVLSQLEPSDLNIIQTAIENYNNEFLTKYNIKTNVPDIEQLINMVCSLKTSCNGYYNTCRNLECKIKDLIYQNLKGVSNPNLKYHIKFLKYIKNKIGSNYNPFWIFTTNYDLLFELAAAHVKVPLENGFSGTILRYFDIDSFKRINGYLSSYSNNRCVPFNKYNIAHIKLCKLHGSLSWYQDNTLEIIETFNDSLITDTHKKIMIYPEKNKSDETLAKPYDKLFALASNVIGNEVNYIVSSGYSFRDEHINDRLIIPKLESGNVRIMALFETAPECINKFKKYNSFNYITKSSAYIDGYMYDNYPNDLWKFSKFVEFITSQESLNE